MAIFGDEIRRKGGGMRARVLGKMERRGWGFKGAGLRAVASFGGVGSVGEVEASVRVVGAAAVSAGGWGR